MKCKRKSNRRVLLSLLNGADIVRLGEAIIPGSGAPAVQLLLDRIMRYVIQRLRERRHLREPVLVDFFGGLFGGLALGTILGSLFNPFAGFFARVSFAFTAKPRFMDRCYFYRRSTNSQVTAQWILILQPLTVKEPESPCELLGQSETSDWPISFGALNWEKGVPP